MVANRVRVCNQIGLGPVVFYCFTGSTDEPVDFVSFIETGVPTDGTPLNLEFTPFGKCSSNLKKNACLNYLNNQVSKRKY